MRSAIKWNRRGEDTPRKGAVQSAMDSIARKQHDRGMAQARRAVEADASTTNNSYAITGGDFNGHRIIQGATLQDAVANHFGPGYTVTTHPQTGEQHIRRPSGGVAERVLKSPEEELAGRQKASDGAIWRNSDHDPFGRRVDPAKMPAVKPSPAADRAMNAQSDRPKPYVGAYGMTLDRPDLVDRKRLAEMYASDDEARIGASDPHTQRAYQIGYLKPEAATVEKRSYQSSIDSAKAQLQRGVNPDRNYELQAAIRYLEAHRGSINSKGEVDYTAATTNIHGFGALNGTPSAMLERAAEARGAKLSGKDRIDALLNYAHSVIRTK